MKLQNKMASIVKSVGNIEHEVYPSNHYLATTIIHSNHMPGNYGYCLPLQHHLATTKPTYVWISS